KRLLDDQIHVAHPAAHELALDGVRGSEGRLEPPVEGVHWPKSAACPAVQQGGSEIGSEQEDQGEPSGRARGMMDDAPPGKVASGELSPEPAAHQGFPDGSRERNVARNDRTGLARSRPGILILCPDSPATEFCGSFDPEPGDRLPASGDDTPVPWAPLRQAAEEWVP